MKRRHAGAQDDVTRLRAARFKLETGGGGPPSIEQLVDSALAQVFARGAEEGGSGPNCTEFSCSVYVRPPV